MPLLDEETIVRELESLPGWKRDGKTIARSMQFNSYMEGIVFVNRVAAEAERQNHHPDMHVGYGTVCVVSWSHDREGITERDIRLAQAINRLFPPPLSS